MSQSEVERWEAMRLYANTSPYYRLLGFEVTEVRSGWAQVRLPVTEQLFQLDGVMHGGAAMSAADSAAALALMSLVSDDEYVTTVELKINYTAPVVDGELIAEARVVQKGRTLGIVDVEVKNHGTGRLVAKVLTTFMVLRNRS